MELPILLAVDTMENWERSSAVLGNSELAIEIECKADGTEVKRLLIGDGKPVGPNAARLRATPEFITGLAETLQQLQHDIDTHGVIHDDTLAGTGLENNPLSVALVQIPGLNKSAAISGDGTSAEFPLPDDFSVNSLSRVEINGLGQSPAADYQVSQDRTIIFTETPQSGDVITLYYTVKGDEE